MKIAVIFAILSVLYCVTGDNVQKESSPKENTENGKTEGTPASTTASPPRARRSPPRFDANQMKGKYAKSNKIKRSLVGPFDKERTNRRERSIADYLSPTPTLIYAVQPPMGQKKAESTPSA